MASSQKVTAWRAVIGPANELKESDHHRFGHEDDGASATHMLILVTVHAPTPRPQITKTLRLLCTIEANSCQGK